MRTIKLSQGFEAMVDDEDFEELNKFKWQVNKYKHSNYAIRFSNEKENIKMHREILNTPKGMQVDHIDGNGLNNVKGNLRIVTQRQNTQNKHTLKSSIYPGVSKNKPYKTWRATISINKKIKHIGCFNTELEAYNAYLKILESIGQVCITKI